MKPNYAEVRRILNLSIEHWMDFLNELNNPLLSKFHLPDETFFEEFYRNNPYQEVREALIIIASHWGRVKERNLKLGMIGLEFAKPQTVFTATLIRSFNDKECANLVSEASRRIDEIEYPIIGGRLKIDLENSSQYAQMIEEYDEQMLKALNHSDPLVRAGIELQLIQRGFAI